MARFTKSKKKSDINTNSVKYPEQKENRKVKNAKVVYVDGIKFLSTFESDCYILLKSSCLKFAYSPETITVWNSRRVDKVYVYETRRKLFGIYKAIKPQDSTYTPDFVIYSHNNKKKIYVEIKGKQNDVFPTKRKMFYDWLQSQMENNKDIELRYAFIKSKTALKQFIDEVSKDDEFGKAVEEKLF